MNKEDAIRKLKALANLATSDNPNEAETAARQMRAMMEQFQLDEIDIAAADVEECAGKSAAKEQPADWERQLAKLVAAGFGCNLIHKPRFTENGSWLFIGLSPAGQIAAYSFEQLAHKGRSARRQYAGQKLRRYKNAANKRKALDAYSLGWLNSVAELFPRQRVGTQQTEAIRRFIDRKYPRLDAMKPIRVSDLRDRDMRHAGAGVEDGSAVQLNRGVGIGKTQKRIGHG